MMNVFDGVTTGELLLMLDGWEQNAPHKRQQYTNDRQ